MNSAAKPSRSGSSPLRPQRRVRGGDPTGAFKAVVTTTEQRAPRPARLPISPALRAKQALEINKRLQPLVEGATSVVITDNRAVMISVRRDARRRKYDVRLHHLFVDAPKSILRDLARYITLNDQEASRRLNSFIEDNDHRIEGRQPATRAQPLRTKGRVYDLQTILDDLNQRYFGGEIGATITWARNRARGNARRSIRLGSCCIETKQIRIHPGLDQEWVPRHYIEWVVFHELLHCVHPVKVINGRRVFHNKAFAADERRFELHELAHAWERRNLAALLCI